MKKQILLKSNPLSQAQNRCFGKKCILTLKVEQCFALIDILRLLVLDEAVAKSLIADKPSNLMILLSRYQHAQPLLKSLHMMLLRLTCNLFAHKDTITHTLSLHLMIPPATPHRSVMTATLVDGMLSLEPSVRACAASLAFNMALEAAEGRPSNGDDFVYEEWCLEMVAAVVKALEGEANEEIALLLMSSLGHLLYRATEEIVSHASVLATVDVLNTKVAQLGSNGTERANRFAECTIVDMQTGALSVYSPLLVNKGAVAGTNFIPPVVPVLPAASTVGCWFGTNGMTTTLADNNGGKDLIAAKCANGGPDGTVFGQFAACNGAGFFKAAMPLVQQAMPALGTGSNGLPCYTSRSFQIIDMDPSDNVVTTYLMDANNKLAQATTANRAALAGAQDITNGSDNLLLDAAYRPALSCAPFTATNLADPAGPPVGSLGLNELQASLLQGAMQALVPPTDPFVVVNGAPNLAKQNAYRLQVNQPPAAGTPAETKAFCQNFLDITAAGYVSDMKFLVGKGSPDPANGIDLLTFLGQRFENSWMGLTCNTQIPLTGVNGQPLTGAPITAIRTPMMVNGAQAMVTTSLSFNTPALVAMLKANGATANAEVKTQAAAAGTSAVSAAATGATAASAAATTAAAKGTTTQAAASTKMTKTKASKTTKATKAAATSATNGAAAQTSQAATAAPAGQVKVAKVTSQATKQGSTQPQATTAMGAAKATQAPAQSQAPAAATNLAIPNQTGTPCTTPAQFACSVAANCPTQGAIVQCFQGVWTLIDNCANDEPACGLIGGQPFCVAPQGNGPINPPK
ncbi:hypothetical protein HDU98_009624 [Podochytrium sp. JEL0797]|nr:hypothetical protein HDU98_009624 [Podochytrium sp. JEL0797]